MIQNGSSQYSEFMIGPLPHTGEKIAGASLSPSPNREIPRFQFSKFIQTNETGRTGTT
jgi:hypothetical protein